MDISELLKKDLINLTEDELCILIEYYYRYGIGYTSGDPPDLHSLLLCQIFQNQILLQLVSDLER